MRHALKRSLSLLMLLTVASGLSACKNDQAESGNQLNQVANTAQADNSTNTGSQHQLSIKTATGDQTILANPQPIAVYDLTTLQHLAALGVAVQGMPLKEIDAKTMSDLNLKAEGSADAVSVGTLFEPDLEALHALKPQAVFVGSRMAKQMESLSAVAPTYNLSIDTHDIYASSKQQLADLGKVFGKAAEAATLQADIDAAITKVKQAAQGKGNGLVVLINGDKMSVYGQNSRYGYLHTTFGIPMADAHIEEARHGQPISFEYLQKTDPDWLFVLDRGAAIGEAGKSAQVVLDNPLIHQTKAWKNNHIIYLSPDSYMAFGGYYQWLKDAKIIADAMNKSVQ